MSAKMAANVIRTYAGTNQRHRFSGIYKYLALCQSMSLVVRALVRISFAAILLTYSEADLSLWRSVFYFKIWHGGFQPSLIRLLAWLFRFGTEPRRVHWCLLVEIHWMPCYKNSFIWNSLFDSSKNIPHYYNFC